MFAAGRFEEPRVSFGGVDGGAGTGRAIGLDAGYAAAMVHMRIVAPREVSELALGMLRESESVCNVIWLPGAAQEPAGDVILADVAREDASVTLSDLKELDIHRTGSIAVESSRPRSPCSPSAPSSGRTARRPMRLSGKRSSRARASRWSCPARTCCSSCWLV
jgi:hypothetical protein